jgi:hypothetical protein
MVFSGGGDVAYVNAGATPIRSNGFYYRPFYQFDEGEVRLDTKQPN